MALQQRGKLVLNKGAGWQIEIDEGTVSLRSAIQKAVQAEARRKKKRLTLINERVTAQLLEHKDKSVEISVANNGDFGIKDLTLEPA